jgi:hypothetical protein
MRDLRASAVIGAARIFACGNLTVHYLDVGGEAGIAQRGGRGLAVAGEVASEPILERLCCDFGDLGTRVLTIEGTSGRDRQRDWTGQSSRCDRSLDFHGEQHGQSSGHCGLRVLWQAASIVISLSPRLQPRWTCRVESVLEAAPAS